MRKFDTSTPYDFKILSQAVARVEVSAPCYDDDLDVIARNADKLLIEFASTDVPESLWSTAPPSTFFKSDADRQKMIIPLIFLEPMINFDFETCPPDQDNFRSKVPAANHQPLLEEVEADRDEPKLEVPKLHTGIKSLKVIHKNILESRTYITSVTKVL